MISLLSARKSVSPMLPRDCVQHVTQFTDTNTTLSMFLVCRSWYHSVDRIVLLGDTYYNVPERYVADIIRRRQIPACESSSLPTLQVDARWGCVDVMVFKARQDTLQGGESFPSTLASLYLRDSNGITSGFVEQLSMLTSLASLNLSFCTQITDACLAHISTLTSLTSLDLTYCFRITEVSVANVSKLRSIT
eukprot:PhF_6_TR42193/c0_g2_i1/m.63849